MNKLVKVQVKPTTDQILNYNNMRSGIITRSTNLRFGKVVLTTDQDLDG